MKVVIAQYEKHETEIRSIREAVFVIEQQISLDLEIDNLDAQCVHAIVFDQHVPIATGRLDLTKQGKIGRVSVLREHRRRGAGRLIMQALEKYAREHQLKKIWFHAQQSSLPFYTSLGYKSIGEEFIEADIVHQEMEKILS
ncbi:MAG: GNAT family N-acetyltransferase [Planctomycetaceae bacterium]|nr:GNAT family N-acetyltransferase [Planctomycetaceae bacterium]